ncbi:NAD(P)-dependent oxidoreductase [Fodinicurvata halophila]|uniref:NAD(P)-dependent oxidoreductase n=3 Tax=Fodinicurvata halophila TaxID=1419723 RepID=A0ABV8UPT1_9PROT
MGDAANPVTGPIGFVGLGNMGAPMCECLARGGHALRLFDLDGDKRRAVAEATGGTPVDSLAELPRGCQLVITMLPDSPVVEAAVLGTADSPGLVAGLEPGAVVVDMSSCAPLRTVALGDRLAEHGIAMVDAPVSGGVPRARSGKLAIMAGGDPDQVARVRPVLQAMGTLLEAGPLGAGHAAKALNNFVSAAGLAAACEAVNIARRFGIEGQRMTDILNASTGRNNSTENKLAQYILNHDYGSGFALSLMAKDLTTASDLAAELGLDTPTLETSVKLWAQARAQLPADADHTEIARLSEPKDG